MITIPAPADTFNQVVDNVNEILALSTFSTAILIALGFGFGLIIIGLLFRLFKHK